MLAGGAALGFLAALLFFRQGPALGALPLIGAFGIIRLGRKKIALARKNRMSGQLRDYLVSVLSFLRAGYALENAMIGAQGEISGMYGADSLMGREALRMSNLLKLQHTPEQLWRDFGARSGLPEGEQMARIVQVAKRQGGDYLPVLKSVVRMMDEQLSLKREIAALLAGQRLEYYVMCLVPAGMLLYLNLSAPDMTVFLYRDQGPLIMSAFLLFYAAAVLWGDRILEKSYEA